MAPGSDAPGAAVGVPVDEDEFAHANGSTTAPTAGVSAGGVTDVYTPSGNTPLAGGSRMVTSRPVTRFRRILTAAAMIDCLAPSPRSRINLAAARTLMSSATPNLSSNATTLDVPSGVSPPTGVTRIGGPSSEAWATM